MMTWLKNRLVSNILPLYYSTQYIDDYLVLVKFLDNFVAGTDIVRILFPSIHIYHILDYDALMISYLMYTMRLPHVS